MPRPVEAFEPVDVERTQAAGVGKVGESEAEIVVVAAQGDAACGENGPRPARTFPSVDAHRRQEETPPARRGGGSVGRERDETVVAADIEAAGGGHVERRDGRQQGHAEVAFHPSAVDDAAHRPAEDVHAARHVGHGGDAALRDSVVEADVHGACGAFVEAHHAAVIAGPEASPAVEGHVAERLPADEAVGPQRRRVDAAEPAPVDHGPDAAPAVGHHLPHVYAAQPAGAVGEVAVGPDGAFRGHQPPLVDDENAAHVGRHPQPPTAVEQHVVGPVGVVAAGRLGQHEVAELPSAAVVVVDAVVCGHPDVAVGVLVDGAHAVVGQRKAGRSLPVPRHVVEAGGRAAEPQQAVGASHPQRSVALTVEVVQAVAVAAARDVGQRRVDERRTALVERQSVVGAHPDVAPGVGVEGPDDVVGQAGGRPGVVDDAADGPIRAAGEEPVVGADPHVAPLSDGQRLDGIALKRGQRSHFLEVGAIQRAFRPHPVATASTVERQGVDQRLPPRSYADASRPAPFHDVKAVQ